jgi:hypothetical protein
MRHPPLHDNPLLTRDDLARACRDLIDPLFARLTPGQSQVDLRSTATHYQDLCIGLEGFSRALFGLVPYVAGGFDTDDHYSRIVRAGLTNGTDPAHPEYWGDPAGCHQAFIEMGPIALGLLLAPDRFFRPLTPAAQANVLSWLGAIYEMVRKPKNQVFFRVLTVLALEKVESPLADRHAMLEDLAIIDGMYLGDGWYNDANAGNVHRSIDYYNPMAIHFYGLIYTALARDTDARWPAVFAQRARAFAPDFAQWFDTEGRGIPFGRSLCYRTAQSAFWAGLAFADVEALPWGEVRGLLLRNLRDWLRRPIFSETGILSIGYGYPSLYMAEEYNSPTSPYWAMKPFLALAVPESHAFWQARELPLRKRSGIVVQPYGRHILCDSPETGHLFLLNGGGSRDYHLLHIEEKYMKFAYSATFGFNVSTDTCCLPRRAPDNTLLVSDDAVDEEFVGEAERRYYRERGFTTDHAVGATYVSSRWKPWADVEIDSWLLAPALPWHVRLHRVVSGRDLYIAEGGFPLPRTEHFFERDSGMPETVGRGIGMVTGDTGLSGVCDPTGARQGEITINPPNSNLLHRRTLTPVLRGKVACGTTWLVTLVYAHPDPAIGLREWQRAPDLAALAAAMPPELEEIFAAATADAAVPA